MTKAIDLTGKFWQDRYLSAVPATIADAAEILINTSAFPGNTFGGRLYPVTINTADRVLVGSQNRYPLVCPFTPIAVLTSCAADGQLLLDAEFDASYIYFNSDVFLLDEIKSKSRPINGGTQTIVWALEASTPTPSAASFNGTFSKLLDTIELVYDTPVVREAGEVLEVTQMAVGTIVITSYEVLRVPDGISVTVSVGDTVVPGDTVCEAWRLIRLGPGDTAEPVLAVPSHRLLPGVSGTLVWHNTNTATVVDTVSSKTRIRWALGGAGADVTAFWSAVHARAVSGFTSLAEALDARPTPTGQPTAFDLPSVVNPANFLCRNVFRGSAYLIEIDSTKLGPNAIESSSERQSRLVKSVDPHIGVFEFDGIPTTAAVLP